MVSIASHIATVVAVVGIKVISIAALSGTADSELTRSFASLCEPNSIAVTTTTAAATVRLLTIGLAYWEGLAAERRR